MWVISGKDVHPKIVYLAVKIVIFKVAVWRSCSVNPHSDDLALFVHPVDQFLSDVVDLDVGAYALVDGHQVRFSQGVIVVEVVQVERLNEVLALSVLPWRVLPLNF